MTERIAFFLSPLPMGECAQRAGEGLKRKYAFTLAEVLITLGIIGIIAAHTIPALMASYEKMVIKQQFKKTYSMLSQAFTKVTNDYGTAPACYYYLGGDNMSFINSTATTEDCKQVNKDLRVEIKIIKTCDSQAYKNGCIPRYKGFDTMAVENNPDLSEEDAMKIVAGQTAFYQNAILNIKPAFVLADGTIILDTMFPMIFAVDINGKKGPNKWGYDLFSFWGGANNNTGLKLIPTTYLVEKGGKTTLEMVRDLNK